MGLNNHTPYKLIQKSRITSRGFLDSSGRINDKRRDEKLLAGKTDGPNFVAASLLKALNLIPIHLVKCPKL